MPWPFAVIIIIIIIIIAVVVVAIAVGDIVASHFHVCSISDSCSFFVAIFCD